MTDVLFVLEKQMGPTGMALLDKMMRAIGVPARAVTLDELHTAECPRLYVALGTAAARAFNLTFGEARGKVTATPMGNVLVTRSPALILKRAYEGGEDLRQATWDDLRVGIRWLESPADILDPGAEAPTGGAA